MTNRIYLRRAPKRNATTRNGKVKIPQRRCPMKTPVAPFPKRVPKTIRTRVRTKKPIRAISSHKGRLFIIESIKGERSANSTIEPTNPATTRLLTRPIMRPIPANTRRTGNALSGRKPSSNAVFLVCLRSLSYALHIFEPLHFHPSKPVVNHV